LGISRGRTWLKPPSPRGILDARAILQERAVPTSLSPPFTLRVTEIVGIEKSDVRLKSILIQSLINQTGWDFFSKSWQIPAQWRTTDGFTYRLDCITDDRGLFSLSVCHKAVVPRWLYAGYWWWDGVVLRARVSALGNACTDAVCPQPIRRQRTSTRVVFRAH
jgi:hypothetical protein